MNGIAILNGVTTAVTVVPFRSDNRRDGCPLLLSLLFVTVLHIYEMQNGSANQGHISRDSSTHRLIEGAALAGTSTMGEVALRRDHKRQEVAFGLDLNQGRGTRYETSPRA